MLESQAGPVIFAAGTLMPISSPPLRDGAVLVREGRIEAVGDLTDIGRENPGAEVRFFPNNTIIPGAVNAHAHLGFRRQDAPEGATFSEWLRGLIERLPEKVTQISEEQAFAEFKDKFEDQPDLYKDLDLGVFPPSIQIQLEDPDSASAVAERLKEQGFTERNLSYPQQTIDRLNSITSYVIWGLYGATLLFLVASVLLISNAIRLSIFARRKEIEVMKLVGASDGFVRTPFVFEGLLQA